jgi:hypothetical protein
MPTIDDDIESAKRLGWTVRLISETKLLHSPPVQIWAAIDPDGNVVYDNARNESEAWEHIAALLPAD